MGLKIIGLTGGIASGKSTVANMIKEYNIPIVDADVISREVVEPGKPAYLGIVEAFGEEILDVDGNIDRIKLGSIIFNNEEKRNKLNGIVHPAVRSEMQAQKEQHIHSGASAVVLDIPLLFESKLTYMVDQTLVVFVNPEIQLERLMERNKFSKEEALARIQSQMPLIEKKELADHVIDNNGTLSQTKAQLEGILKEWHIL
ncbi:dephospho-CoA kinase [Bacillus mesophilus]|uniref:Dephospho-CoA kinase n=1 Tax=Bacillus mesophilus TaxID=1808955 RepID=A0A6M0Q6C1_9BACI|nr:dephospho-CoA kinase [Bacillus mesophilus]MBM7660580.1 dephospho-CoA kinase [Bacillus mesophilus]NEY71872.1 dephospho-CoA kinase [Bacillus mesophilus]